MNSEMKEDIMVLAQENPGALRALTEMVKADKDAIEIMKESGLYGPQIWIAYKDYGGFNVEMTLEAIKNKDSVLSFVLALEGYTWG
jgi:hypothetical protein